MKRRAAAATTFALVFQDAEKLAGGSGLLATT